MVLASIHSIYIAIFEMRKLALQESVFYNSQTVLDLVNQKSAALVSKHQECLVKTKWALQE